MIGRRRLGRTGLEVSAIGLGAVEIGMRYGVPGHPEPPPDERTAIRLVQAAIDRGITFIDTAPAYGDSERLLGLALGPRRRDCVLATKVASHHGEGLPRGTLDRVVRASVEQSLRRLSTDWIDLLFVHCAWDERIGDGPLRDTLGRLQEAGAVRFVGASVYGVDAGLAAIECDVFDCLQIAYSVLDRRPEPHLLPASQRADVGIVARSVLLKGALSARGRHLPPALEGLSTAVEALTALGPEVPELSYRYVLGHPAVHTALVGTAHLDELEAALAYAGRGPLPGDLRDRIAGVSPLDDLLLDPPRWPSA